MGFGQESSHSPCLLLTGCGQPEMIRRARYCRCYSRICVTGWLRGPIVEGAARSIILSGDDTSQRREQLEAQLCIGEQCSVEDRAALTGMILANHHNFALSDHELGEVKHEVNHTPVATLHIWTCSGKEEGSSVCVDY